MTGLEAMTALELRSVGVHPPRFCGFAVFQYKPTFSLSRGDTR